ncbi:YIL102C-A [Zygosaccharomyces parabailii]|nr:YIL102C-A [Zygosaccharomyces parabailii]
MLDQKHEKSWYCPFLIYIDAQMNRFLFLTAAFAYYTVWLLLPIFDLDRVIPLFPLPSVYAVYIPIILLLAGFTLVGTFLGCLLLFDKNEPVKRC